MALKIGHAIAKGIFDRKDTEEPFHPWWEKLQDYICYSTILIGSIMFIENVDDVSEKISYRNHNSSLLLLSCFRALCTADCRQRSDMCTTIHKYHESSKNVIFIHSIKIG